MCAGFFGMFLIEECMHAIFLRGNSSHGHGHQHSKAPPPAGEARGKNHQSLTRKLSMRLNNRRNYQHQVDDERSSGSANSIANVKQQESGIGNGQQQQMAETYPINSRATNRYDLSEPDKGI